MTGYVERDYSDNEAGLSELLDFLSTTYPLNGWLHNWSLNRMGDWRFGGNSIRAKTDPGFFARNVRLWDQGQELVGFSVAEYGDLVFLQVHPHHRGVEADMLRWNEECWGKDREKVQVAAFEVDAWRQSLLIARGYRRTETAGVVRKYDSFLSAREPQLPPGFRIMSLAEFGDEDSYIEAVRTSFRRDMLDRTWFSSKVKAPGYSHGWNICVISPDNRVASFADVRIDSVGGYAEIDPIGTIPDLQKMGLAKNCLRECFRRLAKAGIRDVHIGSAPPPDHSNRLYDSLGPVFRIEEFLWERS